jgi:hypothetical protein
MKNLPHVRDGVEGDVEEEPDKLSMWTGTSSRQKRE